MTIRVRGQVVRVVWGTYVRDVDFLGQGMGGNVLAFIAIYAWVLHARARAYI